MDETQGANVESVETPVASPTTEETPATQAATSSQETASDSDPAADDSAQTTTEERMVPYSRFAQVVEERNRYRDQGQPAQGVQPVQATGGGYKSFDQNLGYPTDPGEYAHWLVQLSKQHSAESAEQASDIREFKKNYGEFVTDQAFLGAVVALQSDAKRRGQDLTLSQSAEKVMTEFAAKWKKEGAEEARAGEVAKTQSTVSKGKPQSSTATGSVGKAMSPEQFFRLPKAEQKKQYAAFHRSLVADRE